MKNVHRLLILLSLGLFPGLAPAMNPKVDSLLRVLESNVPGDKVEVLWGIAYELFDVNNAEALFYATRAYQEVWKGGDSLQIVKVGTTYGQLLRRMDRVEESMNVSTQLLPIAKRNDLRKYTKMLLNSLALGHTFKLEYDNALEYHFESLAMRQREGNSQEIAVALLNIGTVYYSLGDYELSIEHLNKSLEFSLAVHDSTNLRYVFQNIGLAFTMLKKYELALDYFDRALKIGEDSSNRNLTAPTEYGFAECYFHSGKYDSSRVHALRSLTLAKDANDQRFQIINHILLARIALQYKQLLVCNNSLSQAELFRRLSEYPQLQIEICKVRAEYYSATGAYEAATRSLKQLSLLREEIVVDEVNRGVRRAHTKFAQAENARKIEMQSKIMELQGEVLSRLQWIIALCLVLGVALGCLALVFFKLNRQKERINEILDKRVKERTEELSAQRDMLQHEVDQQEVFRRRVFEQVIALTSTLKGLLQLGRREISNNPSVYFQEAEATTARIGEVVAEYRNSGKVMRQ